VRTLILILLVLLLAGIEGERRKAGRSERPTASRMSLQRLRQTRFYRVLVRCAEAALALSALGQAIVAFWGPFWPTRPEIQFHDTIDASSFVLPFKMTNRSVWFSMDSMKIVCGVDLLYFIDADGKTGLLRDAQFDPGPISIARNSFTNYPCSASDYVRIRPDGSLMMGFEAGQSMTTPPSTFSPPLTVLKMCLWMSGDYKVFGHPVPFASKIFQWPAAPHQRQWIEGPIAPDLPSEAWIPEGSRIGGVWALRKMMTADGKQYLAAGLQCTHIE
jgi:hypothetical protein